MNQTRLKRNGTLVICSKIIVVRRMLVIGCPTVATNAFIDEVRKVDNTIISDAELEAQSQQVNIQRAFIQWLKTEFVAQ